MRGTSRLAYILQVLPFFFPRCIYLGVKFSTLQKMSQIHCLNIKHSAKTQSYKYWKNPLNVNFLVPKKKDKISAGADGGPCSQVCACLTLRSAPHRHQRKFFGKLVLELGSTNVDPKNLLTPQKIVTPIKCWPPKNVDSQKCWPPKKVDPPKIDVWPPRILARLKFLTPNNFDPK